MQSTIQRFRIHSYEFPRQRPIGDSQVIATMHYIGVLELECDSGERGLGFFGALFHPLPSVTEMERIFSQQVFPAISGQSPFVLTNRLSRPRGGNIRGHMFGAAIDHAVWDLQGKLLNMPLYRLLGGTSNKVKAYASGLDYHMTLAEMEGFFAEAATLGFSAFKIKVGHPDLSWDLERLHGVTAAVGKDALLMVDANEAWSPKEAIRRLHTYRDAGFNIYWVEDPCLRDDYEGLNRIREAVPFTHLNSGEYLDLHGKRLLMEHKAVDILNIHGSISDNRHAAWLAGEYGIPVSLGNTPFELGVHSAASMPESTWLEYSFQDYNHLIANPIKFVDGYAIAPDRPGHGLELSEFALAQR
jgi:L-alanine-DL-glutamate epimerase-like enolase superfamily enzyme